MTVDPADRISPIPPDARPFQGQPAGVVTRVVAAVVDALVVGVVLLGGYFALVGLLLVFRPRDFSFPQFGALFTLAVAFGVAFVYLTAFWTVSGRSYGDLVMGLRVVRASGRRLGLPGAAARAALVLVFPVGLFWVPVGRGNRSLQDLAMRTQVIYDWQQRGAPIELVE